MFDSKDPANEFNGWSDEMVTKKNATMELLETLYSSCVHHSVTPLGNTDQLNNYAIIYMLSDIRTILKHNDDGINVSCKQPRF